MITQNLISQLMPNLASPDVWTSAVDYVCNQYSINTSPRICMFLAQTMVESQNYTQYVENLNYTTAARLLAIYPTHFSGLTDAQNYVGNPEMIANRVYANRGGNGDEASGDGWSYRGRGLIQLTFKNNYTAFAQSQNMALEDVGAYMETPTGAAMVAGWFWDTNKLNELADADEFTKLSERINGGDNGLEARKEVWATVQQAVSEQIQFASTTPANGSSS